MIVAESGPTAPGGVYPMGQSQVKPNLGVKLETKFRCEDES